MPDTDHPAVEGIKGVLRKLDLGADLIEILMSGLLLAKFFKKDEKGKTVPNEANIPTLAKEGWHQERFNSVLDQLTEHERNAIELDWIPTLCEAANAHLIVSIGKIAMDSDPAKQIQKEQRAVRLLRRIARAGSNQERTEIADSLNLIKNPPSEYWQVKLEDWAGERINDWKQFERIARQYAASQNPNQKFTQGHANAALEKSRIALIRSRIR